MGAFFGAKAAEQAKLRSETMGGPPLNSLILKPYFVGGPETVTGAFDVLRQCGVGVVDMVFTIGTHEQQRSEEHTSELQSLMRISYAVFCFKTKNINTHIHNPTTTLTTKL